MSDNPWHKRYHSDALSGYMNLTLEQRGAYTTILDLLYDRGEPIQDNERLMAGYLNVSLRKYRAIRDQLVGMGKIFINEDGLISNKRFEKEREKTLKTSRKQAENAKRGAEKKAEQQKKDNKNNDTVQPTIEPASNLPDTRSHIEDITNVISPDGDSEWLFSEGADYLVSKRETRKAANSVIGLWLNDHPPPIVREALQQAQVACAANPTAFVAKVLRAKGSAQDAKPVMDEKWADALERFNQRFA
jgi:uncharacterized protein YdaU (DUF1376 family)